MPPRALIKRNDELEVRELPGNEMLVYDQQQRVTHFLAPATAFIWGRCDGKNSRSDSKQCYYQALRVCSRQAFQ